MAFRLTKVALQKAQQQPDGALVATAIADDSGIMLLLLSKTRRAIVAADHARGRRVLVVVVVHRVATACRVEKHTACGMEITTTTTTKVDTVFQYARNLVARVIKSSYNYLVQSNPIQFNPILQHQM